MRWNREGYINSASKPIEIIQEDARIINVITSDDHTLKDPHEIAFVVSKTRGFDEYKKVSRHEERSKNPNLKFGPYNEHLLATCFRGWS